ncbi:MAG: diaminopimelate epimerase [Candidatus Eremiobacteraeota bacterium]|nr:diaminopimelate epimerase [Candidatus Eremiobacteraeota bacterium]
MLVTKMHGARNDFVLVDARMRELVDPSSVARWICDRRSGVGADGLIVLEKPDSGDVRMRIVNADGSEAEMCGNGVRCAARWLDESGEGDRVAFETGAGLVRTAVVAREPEYLVRVAIERPHLVPISGRVPIATRVDVGNPHVVIFETNVEAFDLEALAKNFQADPEFPNGTNVHVAAPIDIHSIRARHWERGAGLTQACGTGAVACAVVALDKKLVDSPVEVFVPGGRLIVEWDGEGEAYLTGPAARVFDTEVSFGASVHDISVVQR